MKSRLHALAWLAVACVGCYGGQTPGSGDLAGAQGDGSAVGPDGAPIGADGEPIDGDAAGVARPGSGNSGSTDGTAAGSEPGVQVDPATGLAGSGALGGVPDVCFLPPDSGPCEAAIPRVYYDPATGACERFVYGGCGGNENNFESVDVCTQKCGGWQGDATTGCPAPERWCASLCSGEMIALAPNCPVSDCACGVPPPPSPEPGPNDTICGLPPEPGPCDGSFERYYFDAQVGTCVSFVYGGCGGNANNFDDLMFCLATCGGANAGRPCDEGRLLGPDAMCDGVVADGRCFRDPYGACACLGCPEAGCAVTVSWPRTAVCL